MFKRFIKNTSGNMTIMMAGALVLLLLVIGVAIDYSSMTSKKVSYQAYADAAVLGAARSNETDIAIIESAASAHVNALNTSSDSLSITANLSNAGKVQINVDGTYNPTFLSIFGYSSIPISATAESALANSQPVDVVLVLDTTYSMTGAKIASLKTAATELVNNLERNSSGNLKISVIPFAQYINVGLSRRSSPWLENTTDYSDSNNVCRDRADVIGQNNCRMERYSAIPARPATAASTCYNDGVPYACGGSAARPAQPAGTRRVCDNIYGPTYQQCNMQTTNYVWDGCVGSRLAPWNQRAQYGGNRISGIMNIPHLCGTEILPLTTDFTSVKSKINSLTPVGETYLPSGILWGWRALMPSTPLTETSGAADRKSIMIFMTEGS
ncbi:MAG: pilus assembly protein TadG-related protein, partial [Robiginitomaculum sp.]